MSDATGPFDLNYFAVDVESDESQALVQVKGEVDVATAPVLEQRLSELVESGVREIILDVAELTFVDTTGLATLVRTAQRLGPAEGRLRLRAPRPNVRKTLEITGLDQLFLQS